MSAFQIIPKEVENAFGSDGAEKFVLFLNQGFENQKTNVLQIVNDSFHDHVTMEVSRVRLEVAELRTELKTEISELRVDMAELRTELKTDIGHLDNKISELRTELKTDIAQLDNKISELRVDMAGLRTELKTDIANLRADFKADNADLHKAISGQTRWLLAILLAGVILYPIAVKIVDRVFPDPKSPIIMQNSPAQD
jgi:hypothetical protein